MTQRHPERLHPDSNAVFTTDGEVKPAADHDEPEGYDTPTSDKFADPSDAELYEIEIHNEWLASLPPEVAEAVRRFEAEKERLRGQGANEYSLRGLHTRFMIQLARLAARGINILAVLPGELQTGDDPSETRPCDHMERQMKDPR